MSETMDDRRWPTYTPRNLTLDRYVTDGAPAGKGSFYVKDTEGKVYLDAINGIGCTPLGHGDPRWNTALAEQASKLVSAPGTIYTEAQQAAAREIAERTPIADARVFLGNTGTEVTEAAIKIATRTTGRDVIVAFERAFHGRSLGSIALTGNPAYREPYVSTLGEPPSSRFAHMNVARAVFNDLESLEHVMNEYGDRVAMICLEPVQGEGGIHPASLEFLRGLHRLARRYGALIGLDEIQCGIGRTGDFSAWTTLTQGDPSLDFDITWYAKALGGGYPVAACVAKPELAAQMVKGSHGSTFGGNPLASAMVLATLRIMDDDRLWESAGRQLATLKSIAEQEPLEEVIDVRGCGAMIGIDFGDADRALGVMRALQDLGVLVVTSGGTAIRSLLAYHAGEDQLRSLWTAIRKALASL